MTKGELLKELEGVPDDQEIRVFYRFGEQDSPMEWIGVTVDGELIVTEA